MNWLPKEDCLDQPSVAVLQSEPLTTGVVPKNAIWEKEGEESAKQLPALTRQTRGVLKNLRSALHEVGMLLLCARLQLAFTVVCAGLDNALWPHIGCPPWVNRFAY